MDLVGRSNCKWSSCFDVLQVPNCNWALIQKSHIIWCKFMRCMSCQRIIMYFMYCHVNVLSCTVMYLIAVHCIFRTENTKIYKTCKLGNTHTHIIHTHIYCIHLGFRGGNGGHRCTHRWIVSPSVQWCQTPESGRVWMCFELFDISRRHSAWCKYVSLRHYVPHSNTVTDLSVQYWESFNFLHLQQVHFKPK